MALDVSNWIHYKQDSAIKNGARFLEKEYPEIKEPQELYRLNGYSYMKFFKMDTLCKWAWLGAEELFADNSMLAGVDKSKVAVVLMTSSGCIDVDKKYKATMANVPSPALFVYTLPNIMLGEICIRHGFKGEQLCLVSKEFDAEEISFWVNDLLNNRGMEACICGWVDAYDDKKDVALFWVTKDGEQDLSEEHLKELYSK